MFILRFVLEKKLTWLVCSITGEVIDFLHDYFGRDIFFFLNSNPGARWFLLLLSFYRSVVKSQINFFPFIFLFLGFEDR